MIFLELTLHRYTKGQWYFHLSSIVRCPSSCCGFGFCCWLQSSIPCNTNYKAFLWPQFPGGCGVFWLSHCIEWGSRLPLLPPSHFIHNTSVFLLCISLVPIKFPLNMGDGGQWILNPLTEYSPMFLQVLIFHSSQIHQLTIYVQEQTAPRMSPGARHMWAVYLCMLCF